MLRRNKLLQPLLMQMLKMEMILFTYKKHRYQHHLLISSIWSDTEELWPKSTGPQSQTLILLVGLLPRRKDPPKPKRKIRRMKYQILQLL